MSEWKAHITISKDDLGYFHVLCATDGTTEQDCLDGAQFVFAALTTGKQCYVRAEPQTTSDRDYDTGATVSHGRTRFTFRDEPGEAVIHQTREESLLIFCGPPTG